MGWCIVVITLLIFCFEQNYVQAVSFIRGNATCDDEMSFYADGVLYAESDNWDASSPISIPCNTTVMAIKCQDKGGIAGIKAGLDNGIKTDISWKCSNTFESGWNQIGFNDSAWSFAVTQDAASWRSHAASLVGKADWIWTSGYKGKDLIAYCRKVLNSATGTSSTTTSLADTTTAPDTYTASNNSTSTRPNKEFNRLCGCKCRTRPIPDQSNNLQAKITSLQTVLKVQVEALSSTKRRRKSAADSRVSSSIIGTTSAIILISAMGVIILADILTLIKHIYSNFLDVRKKDSESGMT